MKIAYVIEWNVYAEDGVTKKIETQVAEWISNAEEVKIIALTPRGVGLPKTRNTVCLHFAKRGILGRVEKITLMGKLKREISVFEPDIVYYRQGAWMPGLSAALKQNGRLIMEVNSDEMGERRVYSFLQNTYTQFTRRMQMSMADAFVSVSRQVAESLTKYGKKVIVIGNSYGVRKIQRSQKMLKERPTAVMVTSGGQEWHGLDYLELIAKGLPDIDFIVAGIERASKTSNVIYIGKKNSDELASIYSQADVGVGSLALDRIGIHEISPLKTREYLAYGLPVIGAYTDTDIPPDFEGFLKISNDWSEIENITESIGEFVKKWRGRTISIEDADKLIGAKKKENERLNFFRLLLSES